MQELELNYQNRDKKVRELESALQTYKESNEILLEDKEDLQKQLIEVESICKQQLLLTQAQAAKTQMVLKETIAKQSEDKKLILDVINNQKQKTEDLEQQLQTLRTENQQL